ncbi:MAG: HNH endonuclease [Candidatus Diapherotrites archaeon]|nr:HNH endonuclease [Candidatus Diapherotrites archaeon]
MLGCSHFTILKYLKKFGIKIRTISESIKKARIKGKNLGGWGKGYSFDKGYKRSTRKDSRGVFLHRVVVENHRSKKLTKQEHVHHIDEDRSNNNIENLKVLSRGEHTLLHHKMGSFPKKG